MALVYSSKDGYREESLREKSIREQQEQQAREKKKLDSLIPSEEEIRKAETELLIIDMLKESGLIE